jgi:hypothetical protein
VKQWEEEEEEEAPEKEKARGRRRRRREREREGGGGSVRRNQKENTSSVGEIEKVRTVAAATVT